MSATFHAALALAIIAVPTPTPPPGGVTAEAEPSPPRGEYVWVEGARRTRLYQAGPVDAAAAVLVVHDWFGISEATEETVERLAGLGYRAAAVDLYDGEAAQDHPGANALMNTLDPEAVGHSLETALDHLGLGSRPVGALGFSMGGAPAARTALIDPRVAAVASVYGGGVEQTVARAEDGYPSPLLLVTGADDAWPMTSARALLSEDPPGGVAAEVHVLPGVRHGYAQPLFRGGENLDSEATRISWLLIEDFLARHLE